MTTSKTPKDYFQKLTESHPFISVLQYAGQDFVGIVQNRDDIVTSIYDYGAIKEVVLKEKFLILGDVWWWESNRQIPINLFLKDEWSMFRPFIKTFNNKALNILHGPTVSMSDFQKRRIKRKTITLVKKVR
jgi:hypothetical protein|tara:strand:+ start:107 stop:499 length:393 start_codon:yes stop_codon:yes gene_type:complete